MKKVSIIIPIYNAGKYLSKTLNSVVHQTYKNLEIVCVLDAPTDDSEKIVKSFKDARIKIVKHKKNMDLPAARNTGAKFAKGDYIHFMDADDLLSPDFYAEMLACIRDADVAACSVFYEKKPRRSIWFKNETTQGKDKFKKTKVLTQSWAWRWLIRRNFWNENYFNFPNLVPREDKPVIIPMIYRANKIALCGEAVYFYKNREASILNKKYTTEQLHHRSQNRREARKLVKDFLRSAKKLSSKSEFEK